MNDSLEGIWAWVANGGWMVAVWLGVVALASWIAWRLAGPLGRRFAPITDGTASPASGNNSRAETATLLLRGLFLAVIFSIGILLVLPEFGLNRATVLTATMENWLVRKVGRITLVAILMLVGVKAATTASKKLLLLFFSHHPDAEIKKRAQTLSSMIRYALVFVIAGVGTMMILKELGIEIGPILAGAGIVGLAVGFGAQNLVQDVISGFFILLEDQIRVGDVVAIKGKDGLVEKMTLRMIILRDFSGNVHYIRNGQIEVVTNMTKSFSNYVFELRVGHDQDIDLVISIMKQVDEGMRADPKFKDLIIKPLEVYAIDGFTESAVLIKGRTTTKPIRQWDVGREFNRRLKKQFDGHRVRMAFPQQIIHYVQERPRSTLEASGGSEQTGSRE